MDGFYQKTFIDTQSSKSDVIYAHVSTHKQAKRGELD